MKKIITIYLFLILGLNLSGQEYCKTKFDIKNKDAIIQKIKKIQEQNSLKSNYSNHYTIRIFCHIMRMSNGTSGISNAEVLNALGNLQYAFNPHNICFSLKGIDFIDNDTNFTDYNFDTIIQMNKNTDAIDVYLFGQNSPVTGGRAEGFVFSSLGTQYNYSNDALVVGGQPGGINYYNSHVLSHEMGHVLGLFHTFMTAICSEYVNGSNCNSCGDLVCDTDASQNLNFNNTLIDDVTCQYTGTDTDANGDAYNPDPANIMDYSFLNCMNVFSSGQGARMRGYLSTVSFLQKLILPNDTIINYVTENTTKFVGVNNSITVINTDINNNTSIIYQAGHIITLKPGFHAVNGSEFIAKIVDDCNFLTSPFNAAKHDVSKIKNTSTYIDFNLYPNPFHENIILEFFLKENQTIKVYFYNIYGSLLKSISYEGVIGLNKRKISLHGNKNIIIANSYFDNKNHYKKIIKK